MGMLYKKKKKKADGTVVELPNWHLKYYRDGKPYYESSKTDNYEKALKLLSRREAEVEDGKTPSVVLTRVKYDDLINDLEKDYRLRGEETCLETLAYRRKHLDPFFKRLSLTKINTRKMKAYIEYRQETGVSNATINRELATLSRMFSVARANDMPVHMPVIPRLKEADARKGFFSHAQYLQVLDALPEPYKSVLTFGYLTGWRKNEILNLTWERVSLAEGTVRLEAGETKNEGARNLTLEPELQTLLETLWKGRDPGCPCVFQNDGKKIGGNQGDFNKVWQNACKKAKVDGKLFHDLRRTAVRNMVRAGISEKVAMTISGHKTRSVFERYNIVDDLDLRAAAKKRAAYQERQVAELAAADRLRIGQEEASVAVENEVASLVN